MLFLEKVVTTLNNNGIVLMPTDTHFVLAVNPQNIEAVDKLLFYKNSSKFNEPTLCFGELKELWEWVDVSHWQRKKIEELSQAFWPGPLKIKLKCKNRYNWINDGFFSVVCVKNKDMRNIIKILEYPLFVIPAIPTSNIEGIVTFTSARKHIGNAVDLVVPSNTKIISRTATTYVSLLNDKISLIRQGEVDIKHLL